MENSIRALRLVAAIFLVSSCSGSSQIYPAHVTKADEACKDHGGWVAIEAGSQTVFGRCHDGTSIYAYITKRPDENR